MIKILFVCLGNICRSPAAEAVFRTLVSREGLNGRILVDSAATGDWQVGRPPDDRVQAVARRRGLDLSKLRARQIAQGDFQNFDHVVAMDRANLEDLRAVCPPSRSDRLRLFLDAARSPSLQDVPDPYTRSGLAPFETMFDLIEAGGADLLEWLKERHPAELGCPRASMAPSSDRPA